MGQEPRVLVVAATDERIGLLCRGLDSLGWRTMTARSGAGAVAALTDFTLEVAILDGDHPEIAALPQALRRAAGARRLPIVGIGTGLEEGGDFDMVALQAPHPAQAALRIEQLVRAAIAEEEFRLRQATFALHGATLDPGAPDPAPLKILIAGAPDHRFLALSNTLTAAGAEVIAAPTPYTAFDYLHETAFDAAVLWGAPDHAPALSIASGMKRNTRLYHIPLALYLRSEGEINLSELFHRGFSDVAAADTPEPDTAARVLSLARTHRRHLAIRKALEGARGAGIMDPSTGLFTRTLFASHLGRVAEAATARRRPLSVCVLRLGDNDAITRARAGGWLDRAMPQIGAMVSRLVRVEDTAARLAPEVFALALPATPAAAARLAAERIAAVIGCTAFDAGPDRSPFVADFHIGAAELMPGESAAAVLERASADLNATRSALV
ncbi:diguanylate cyclase domain-containing protein [Brevundimonas subvibrioides]|uniref:Diguanylate cyclase n=1 Tax=Brevundimonas subvibrioides (strain ATCC 15264 / DSM 4735 / LMG 14903 / NBRC 16000 / CB 81) TaxID=633149 RepID=D9QHC0_BRESC|nr:diguanylate cyclase [Brevundimonas subvibrioides ATCC 15264]